MITMIVICIAFIVAVAVVVGIVDATQAPSWRQIAADRREVWESHKPEFHGVEADSWDDD